MYCLCVNVYCHRVSTQLQLTDISISYTLWQCVCSPSYATPKAHAPHYIIIRDLSASSMFFPLYLTNGTIFGRKLLNTKCVCLILQKTFDWNISYSNKNWARQLSQIHKSVYVKHPLISSGLNETPTFSTDFRRILIYQISWKSVQGEPSCYMSTDRHYGAYSRFSEFFEHT
jgi:hypothetical protein